jgi:hypothetical protein
MAQEMTMRWNLVHGEPIAFKGEITEDRKRNLGAAIEKAMAGSYVGVELEGKLTIIPIHNIKSIEIDPAPAILIKSVVVDVERVK